MGRKPCCCIDSSSSSSSPSSSSSSSGSPPLQHPCKCDETIFAVQIEIAMDEDSFTCPGAPTPTGWTCDNTPFNAIETSFSGVTSGNGTHIFRLLPNAGCTSFTVEDSPRTIGQVDVTSTWLAFGGATCTNSYDIITAVFYLGQIVIDGEAYHRFSVAYGPEEGANENDINNPELTIELCAADFEIELPNVLDEQTVPFGGCGSTNGFDYSGGFLKSTLIALPAP